MVKIREQNEFHLVRVILHLFTDTFRSLKHRIYCNNKQYKCRIQLAFFSSQIIFKELIVCSVDKFRIRSRHHSFLYFLVKTTKAIRAQMRRVVSVRIKRRSI